MRREHLEEQLDYLAWARERVLAAAARLAPGDFRSSRAVATRSLRETLAHQVECEWAWRLRLAEGTFPAGDVRAEDFSTVDALAERWRAEGRGLRAWLDSASDADLEAPPPGPRDEVASWRCLLYVVNHGVRQLTEAALLLTQVGQSPGEIGYLEFCSARVT